MRFYVFVVLLFFTTMCAISDTVATLHTFGTAGYVYSTNNNQYLLRDLSQNHGMGNESDPFASDSRLGVQLNLDLTQNLSFITQEVYANRITQNLNDNIEWALLRWTVNENYTIRIGRIGTDIFALSVQRNVGVTYNWVRPPTEIYNFMPVYSVDGADIKYSRNYNNNNTFSIKLFGGKSNPVFYVTDNNPGKNSELDLYPVLGYTMSLENNKTIARLSYVYTKEMSQLPDAQPLINAAQMLSPLYSPFNNINSIAQFQNSTLQFYDFSVNYDDGKWWLYNENTLNLFSIKAKTDKVAFAFGLGRHFTLYGMHILPFVSYSRVYPLRHYYQFQYPQTLQNSNLNGVLNMFNNGYFPGMAENQYTQTFGIRIDTTEHTDVKIQFDKVTVIGYGGQEWQNNLGMPTIPETNIISATFDWSY